MSSLEEERQALRSWTPRVRVPWAAVLVANEFAPPPEQDRRVAGALKRILAHASTHVPYYREMFERCSIVPSEFGHPSVLAGIPVLEKSDVQRCYAQLHSEALPSGEQITGETRSSGTTGVPTRVVQSSTASVMFSLLKHRELRWFRFDPTRQLAIIRLPSQLPRDEDGRLLKQGETFKLGRWPYVGRFFYTGPALGFSVMNPIDAVIAWLEQVSADYLMSYPETFEHLAFALRGRLPDFTVGGMLAISEQLTPSMRRVIESTFGVAIQQNYGLNEIGIVASRCPEGGRYHVHTEHCLVEILDQDARPVHPGDRGRLVVTSLTNTAMPLIRYDTDDLAEATDGPCPCGRTLPSFGSILGRYSRIAFLPEDTLRLVGVLREAVERMAASGVDELRQFQIYQRRDMVLELRVVASYPLSDTFRCGAESAFNAAAPGKAPLRIVQVDRVERGPGGKYQDFMSDFFPSPLR